VASKCYVVTGGTGFIGSSLVRRLVSEGHEVRVVDNDLRGSRTRLNDVLSDITLVQGDARDVNVMTEACRGATSIIHMAALNGTKNFYERPDLVLDVGVRSMLAALDAARANSIKEFILFSSSEAYQTPSIVPTPEAVPLVVPDPWNSRYSYGGGKLISEVMLANYCRDLFERAIVIRPHNVYGPDMGWEHVIPQLVVRATHAITATPTGPVPMPIQGDGSHTRSFIYIDDFVDGLMAVLANGVHRNAYHIGTSDEVTIRHIVETIFAWFGRQPLLQQLPLPEGGTQRRCPDISKLKSLGFAPKFSLEKGVALTADWYVKHLEDAPQEG